MGWGKPEQLASIQTMHADHGIVPRLRPQISTTFSDKVLKAGLPFDSARPSVSPSAADPPQ
jgi:hypothetical protein